MKLVANLLNTLVPPLAALAVAFVAPAALADADYDFVIIEPWDTDYHLATSSASGINNENVVSGGGFRWAGPGSFIWTRETGKQLIDLAGAINDEGVIAGGGAIRYPDGTIVLLGFSTARDLNNQNVVAGAATGRYWGGCRYTRSAYVWDETNGPRRLDNHYDILAAHDARAINNMNEVVGVRSTTGSCGDFEAFYLNLDTGEHIDIHELLTGGSGITEAYDINDDGVVVGDGPFEGELRAFLWSRAGGFTFLPDLPGTLPGYSTPAAINATDVVVGQAIVNEEWRAWIWDETNGIRDLNELVEGLPDDFTIDTAKGINDNGWIIASGHYGSWSPWRAVVLIPRSAEQAATITDFAVLDGRLIAGGLPQLAESDDQYLTIEARVTGEVHQPHLLRVLVGAENQAQSAAELGITIESRITDVEATAWLSLRDWDTGGMVQVDQFTVGMQEAVHETDVPDAARFVRATDGRIELELKEIVFFPFTLNGFHALFDQIQLTVR